MKFTDFDEFELYKIQTTTMYICYSYTAEQQHNSQVSTLMSSAIISFKVLGQYYSNQFNF